MRDLTTDFGRKDRTEMLNQGRHPYNLLGIICALTLWTAQPGMALMVTEVMYHPVEVGQTPAGDENLEFIELYNNRAVFEDLSGYEFTRGIHNTFAPGTILGAREYLVVARDPAAVEAAYGITGVHDFSGKLDNNGERIELSNEVGEIIISFRYNDSSPWPSSPDGTGHSLILARPGGDPEEASTWAPSTLIGGTPGGPDEIQVEPEDPTQVTIVDLGHPGRYFKGTKEPSPAPGGEPTTAWTEIPFNDNPATTDWLDGPSGYGYCTNNDSDEVPYIKTSLDDMQGNYLSVYARLRFTLTAEQISSFVALQAEVRYDDDYVLYLNGQRVGGSGGISGNPPPFDAARSQGHEASPDNLDLTSFKHLLVAGTNVLAIQAHNCTSSSSSDALGYANLKAVVQPEPGDANNISARILINELLTNSDAGAGVDWLELYNPGPIAVDLSNVYLSEGRFELLQCRASSGPSAREHRRAASRSAWALPERHYTSPPRRPAPTRSRSVSSMPSASDSSKPTLPSADTPTERTTSRPSWSPPAAASSPGFATSSLTR